MNNIDNQLDSTITAY